jgi:hypothetical protein
MRLVGGLFAGEHRGDSRKVFQDGVDRVVTSHAFGLIEESAGQRTGFVHRDACTLQRAEGRRGVAEITAEHATGFGQQAAEATAGRFTTRGSRGHEFGSAGQETHERAELSTAGVGGLLFDEVEEDAYAGANCGFGNSGPGV